MSCSNCGSTLPVGSSFCNNCGQSSLSNPQQLATYGGYPVNPRLQQANAQARTKGIVSLVLGIVAWVVPIPVLDVIAGVIGIILGSQARRLGGGGVSTAGFVVSIIGTIVAVIFTISVLTLGSALWWSPMMW